MATKTDSKQPNDYLSPLVMNRLRGRVLRLPAPRGKNREILLIYGQHASLERYWELALELNQYGAVTIPDLPGLGGMTSFYKIGVKPTIDVLADYLAAFVKLRYKRRKVTIMGLGLGFVVVTRMLQRCPDLAKNVELVVSLRGYAHTSDLVSRPRGPLAHLSPRLFSWKPAAHFYKNLFLHRG